MKAYYFIQLFLQRFGYKQILNNDSFVPKVVHFEVDHGNHRQD
ncbi:hypothetical protein PULV_a0901 [Pseudoalteromonas ulvae UL12]|nr:hypothetical protein [Pseudoalteromonas ulvae UL12]